MTFSEYFNGLYYPLKNEEKKAEFFDKMISHFIDEDACKDCTLLHVDSETKPRYVKENKPNPIKADNAKYLYAHRNFKRYTDWIYKRIADMEAYDVIEDWLSKNGIEFEDVSETCYKLLEDIFFNIGFPDNNEKAIDLPAAENDPLESNSGWTERDDALVMDFILEYRNIEQTCSSVGFYNSLIIQHQI